MSTGVVPDHGRMKQQPGAGPAPVQGGVAPGQVRRDQPLAQEHQEFDSWRHQTHQPQQGYNPMSSMANDPYLSSFYAGSAYHYPGFGVGDGTWSNGGDHMTFLGSYGGGMPAGTEAPVPQPYGTDLSQATMFSAGAAGGFGAFTQPAGYGFDFHSASAGYSQWGAGRSGEYYRADPYGGPPGSEQAAIDRQGRVAAAEQAMQGLNIANQQMEKEQMVGHTGAPPKHERHEKLDMSRQQDTNGQVQTMSAGHSKKMSWANIASQPAKPPPPPSKTKKPGVLPPPVVVGSGKHNMDIGTWDGAKQNGVPGVPPPVITGPPPTGPPPKINGNMNNVRGPNMGGPGPRGVKGPGPSQPFGGQSNGAGVPGPSHPVLDELKSVNDYNPRDFDLNPKKARYFVLKSYSEDDIHRSIKYEIWCSTEHGNKRLDSAFRESEGRGPVFLFFSVNGSGHFCGMAEMLSCLDYNSSAGVWAQDKWKGQFKVKWIYVKDVPNSQLRHIRLENNENKPVTNSRDTQEVPEDKGKLVLKIIHGYKHATSIFDDFTHYEKRQEEDEGRKPTGGYKNSSHGRDRPRPDGQHQGHRDEGREDRSDRRERKDDRRDGRRDNRQHEREGETRDPRENGHGEARDGYRDSAPREVREGGHGGRKDDRGGRGRGGGQRGGKS